MTLSITLAIRITNLMLDTIAISARHPPRSRLPRTIDSVAVVADAQVAVESESVTFSISHSKPLLDPETHVARAIPLPLKLDLIGVALGVAVGAVKTGGGSLGNVEANVEAGGDGPRGLFAVRLV